MPLVPLTDILQPALQHGYAVGAFNTFNEDFTDAIISAAAAAHAPVIVSVSEVQLDYIDLECIAAVTRVKAGRADIPACSSATFGIQTAADFVRSTGVDALAVAIGNAHGAYIREPCLDFGRLARLRDALNLPMVLHGGSGISDDDFRRAVENGITKINFYTGMLNAAIRRTAERIGNCGQRYSDYLDVLASVKDVVSAVVGSRISVFLNGRRL